MRVKYFIGTGEELAIIIAKRLNSPFRLELSKTDIPEEALVKVMMDREEILSLLIFDIDFIKHPILADLEDTLDDIFANTNFYIGIIKGKVMTDDKSLLKEACAYVFQVLLEEFNGLLMEKTLADGLGLSPNFKEAKQLTHNFEHYYHYRNMKEE